MVTMAAAKLLACASFAMGIAGAATAKHNIVHVIFDDLRPELGAYGLQNRHTPNMDRLAEGGVTFLRAYAQQAVCGPSRNSFLSGRRPDRSRSWNFINHFREDHPDWTSLPGLFLKAGAKALGSGKSYHPKVPPYYDGSKSWSKESLPYANPCLNTADSKWIPEKYQDGGLPCLSSVCPIDVITRVPGMDKYYNTTVASEYCTVDALEDIQTVEHAIKLLRAHKDEHFYLAVGFHKPHIPWQHSKEDLEKHPLENIDLPKQRVPPKNAPGIALQLTENRLPGHDSPYVPLRDDTTRLARQQYRATLTGVDRKLGTFLDELDRLGLSNNTAVVLHADHSWHLGEQGEWRKFTNFETGVRVPMIIRAPWVTTGTRSASLVELVDIMPTIADLAGIDLPEDEVFDGTSLVPILDGSKIDVKHVAFSQYPRRSNNMSVPWKSNSILHHDRSTFTHMGYSVRTDGWRYTEWVKWNGTTLKPMWDPVVARELYDHRNESTYPIDFDLESDNVAGDVAHADIVSSLSQIARQQFGQDYSLVNVVV